MNRAPDRMFDLTFVGRMAFHDWPHSPHTMAASRIAAGTRVLDIGCSVGHLARELKKKNCKVWGMDIDAEAVKEASAVCEEVVVADFDAIPVLPFADRQFDAILLLDVLEHLARPDRFLPLVPSRVAPQGTVWISLPNVARVEHRWNLLLGRFDYQDGAALSKGHLRFFTQKTARRLIADSGLRIVSEQSTGFASILKSKGVPMFPLLCRLTAYQFLFECVKD